MRYLLLLFLYSLSTTLYSQVTDTLNQNASPQGGVNQLAVKYYGIDFTKEQRVRLKDKRIEFIYQIDELGKPTLSEVNGVTDQDILDSLQVKTLEVENFNPQIRNGTPQPAIYFMQLEFPTYKMTSARFGFLQGMAYNEATLDDFEYIEESKQRLDMLIGGMANQFTGTSADYLGLGGGMKVDLTYSDKRDFLYGLNMSFYGNKLKREYPINTNREQFSAPPTLLVGAVFGKWIDNFNVQTEVGLAVRNLTERLSDNDSGWIQFNGWSPGIVINYPLQLGKQNPMYYYGSPTLLENQINFHFGLRYLHFSLQEASGFMLELGVSYRMTIKGAKKYKLKDKFLNKNQ